MNQQHAGTEREERAANDSRTRSTTTPESRTTSNQQQNNPQKKPSLRRRWGGVQASKTVIFWLLAAAIVLTIIIGFNWGGWMTGGAAQNTADTTAQEAVVMRLAPICVAQFNEDPQRDEKLVELQEMSSYQRSTYVREQGWATMPGEDDPDRRVADACARLLMAEMDE